MWLAPLADAAWTNSTARRTWASLRASRAYDGHHTTITAIAAFRALGPSAVAMAMARTRAGTARKTSVRRMRPSSSQPPT